MKAPDPAKMSSNVAPNHIARLVKSVLVSEAIHSRRLGQHIFWQTVFFDFLRTTSAAAAAGINPENGVPIYLDNLFNPNKFTAPNEIPWPSSIRQLIQPRQLS